jgi:hypothetical protein
MTLWWFLFIVFISSAALAETPFFEVPAGEGRGSPVTGLFESDDDLRLNRLVLHWDV